MIALLRRHRDFRLLWTDETTSQLGNSVTTVVLPLIAVTSLHSSALTVSLLKAAAWLPWLAIGLLVGAWVDQLRNRRWLVIACDVAAAAAFATVPLAWALGALTAAHLLLVALAAGTAAVFFDTTYRAFPLDVLDDPHDRAAGNSALQGSASAAGVGGPGLGGALAYHQATEHYYFDLEGPLCLGSRPPVVDCGDIVGDVRDPDGIWDTAVDTVKEILVAGAVPLVVGGLNAVPPMVVEAFAGIETVHVLHVDAHLDFRDQVLGVTRGCSSPTRRIRELPGVDRIVQVGMRSVGSARAADVADARAAGNRIVTAWELHERGAAAILAELPADRRWVVTIDCDRLDPAIAPGVGWPEPGGLTYPQIRTVIAGLARAGLVAACVVTELPPLDEKRSTKTGERISRPRRPAW